MYLVEYNYRATGEDFTRKMRDFCFTELELKRKLMECQNLMGARNLEVVELEEKRRYKAKAEIVIKEGSE